MDCPNCGEENQGSEPYCTECAIPLETIHRVPMKRRTAIAAYASIGALLVLLLLVLTLASAPGFGHYTVIPAGGQLRIEVVALVGDNLTVSCESEAPLVISVMDPDGFWKFTGGTGLTEIFGPFSETFSVYLSGEWTIVWTNLHEIPVKVSYDASSSTIDSVRAPLINEIAWLVAIIVCLVIVMIAAVALVTLRLHHLDTDSSKRTTGR